MDIRDRVVIMTGASEGIGLTTAKLFTKHGAKVALVARSADKLSGLAAELQDSLAVPADMRDTAAIKQMVDRVHKHYGRIDILINNAGQTLYAPVEQIDLEQYRQIMELNLFGPLAAMQAVIPIMREQGGGMIVNISSGVSKIYIPTIAAYASTKYALNAISLTARTELAKDNIRVSVVYPGRTATNFGKNAVVAPTMQAELSNRPFGGPPPDPVELVADKILEAVQSEVAEQYMSEAQAQNLANMPLTSLEMTR